MAEISYHRRCFPPVIIQHAVWLCLRFTLSYRHVRELVAERGLDISYESMRSWVLKFGRVIARGYDGIVLSRVIDGIWTRWSSGSPASECTFGVPSITRARSSTCSFSAAATVAASSADRLLGARAQRQRDLDSERIGSPRAPHPESHEPRATAPADLYTVGLMF
jgi:hypothetical protein